MRGANQQQSFLWWSIPNYFIHNYARPESANPHHQGSIFIHTFQSYLSCWVQIRGNWMDAFLIDLTHLRPGTNHKATDFHQLLLSLGLEREHMLFIQFMARFYQLMLGHFESEESQQKSIKQISKIYFNYQMEISFDGVSDVGQPPELVGFFRSVSKNISIFNLLPDSSKALLHKLSQECQFERLHSRWLTEQADSPTQPLQSSPPQPISLQSTQPQATTQLNHKSGWDILKPSSFGESGKLSQLKISMEMRTNRKNQITNKIVSTPRLANFRGTFLLKRERIKSQVPRVDKIGTYSQEQKRQKTSTKNRDNNSKVCEGIDFLCEKSF